ncbi:hypothetical protein HFN_0611 [Helicobacter fennelliae MRY12-0050]|uniref:Uncharacterized protein n=1 Tax=Helicobacter fennelliae MRY12-0050 TaxID=1325130 RepID=T1CXU7_9HELI|nr:hypothetical protein HFN_0611 [Helicobacter fennelliae MRY12-0050]
MFHHQVLQLFFVDNLNAMAKYTLYRIYYVALYSLMYLEYIALYIVVSKIA